MKPAQEPVANYARVRRLSNRYCWGIERQIERLKISKEEIARETDENRLGYANYTLKNDWEILLVFLTRLRRCLLMLSRIGSTLPFDNTFVTRFDNTVPQLKQMRDYEEHFDDYSLGKGKNKSFSWGYLESYSFGGEGFANGIGKVDIEACRSAALIVWEAVMSLEDTARKLGYLSWDDRFGATKIAEKQQ